MSKISLIGLAVCSLCLGIVWLACLASPWYFTEQRLRLTTDLNIGIENTTTEFLCFIDGTCIFEQNRQFTGSISGDIELDGQVGSIFDANLSMSFIGFFFLVLHFGFALIKVLSPNSPLGNFMICPGWTAALFLTISPVLFAAGIESAGGIQINDVGGDGFAGNLNVNGSLGLTTIETDFGPQAGFYLTFVVWVFLCCCLNVWTTYEFIATGSASEAEN